MIHPRSCRRRRSLRIRVRAPLAVLFILCFALALDGVGLVRISLLCAVLHESGHVLMFRWQWGYWPDLQISPGGVCLRLRGVPLTPQREFLLAAAGPLCNLLASCVVLGGMELTGACSYLGYWFASVNLLVGGMNLLPLPGLDGARMLRAFRYW